MPDLSCQIQHHRQHHAYHNRRRQRKVKRRVLAAIEDIARQPPYRQVRPPEQHEDQADYDNDQPQPEQHLTNFCHSLPLKGKGPRESEGQSRSGAALQARPATYFFSAFAFPYFRRNRSTRPAVSTSFCFPVKKGWQFEQISTWMSPLWVERVLKVFPHAQCTRTSLYAG